MAPIEATTMPAMAAPIVPPSEGDTRWLTYAELADRLGITGESARNLVRRRRWMRRPGNDGVQRVGVPADYLAEREQPDLPIVAPIIAPMEAPPEAPAVVDIEAPTIAAMMAHIAELKRHLAEVRGDLDATRHERDRERDERHVERGRADRIAAELVELAARFATSTDQGRGREQALQDRLDAAQQRMAELRSRPWWRRLMSAA